MKKYSTQQIVDILQWVLIALLLILSVYVCYKNRQIAQNLEIKKENTYLKIYDSQSIAALKKENKELYDSIKHLKNVESVIEIRYVNRYVSDTIYIKSDEPEPKDSVYHYENKSDSINYKLDIKAKELFWHQLDFKINDKLTLITKEDNGKVETSIETETGNIEGTTMWHRKNKTWKDRIKIGPTVGVGYGAINNKFDTYVGVGVTIDLW